MALQRMQIMSSLRERNQIRIANYNVLMPHNSTHWFSMALRCHRRPDNLYSQVHLILGRLKLILAYLCICYLNFQKLWSFEFQYTWAKSHSYWRICTQPLRALVDDFGGDMLETQRFHVKCSHNFTSRNKHWWHIHWQSEIFTMLLAQMCPVIKMSFTIFIIEPGLKL